MRGGGINYNSLAKGSGGKRLLARAGGNPKIPSSRGLAFFVSLAHSFLVASSEKWQNRERVYAMNIFSAASRFFVLTCLEENQVSLARSYGISLIASDSHQRRARSQKIYTQLYAAYNNRHHRVRFA